MTTLIVDSVIKVLKVVFEDFADSIECVKDCTTDINTRDSLIAMKRSIDIMEIERIVKQALK